MEIENAKIRVAAVSWFHSFDFGDGIVARGHKTLDVLSTELTKFALPDLRGKSVLDINTWDGFFAFEAERRGASRVVALDRYMWQMDQTQHAAYWSECKRKGLEPKPYHEMPYFQPDKLPGKIGFDTAHDLLKSKVEVVVDDFMEMDVKSLGTFDVVFYFGTLYHMEEQLSSIRRLAAVTGGMAIIETEAIYVLGHEHHALCEFFPGSELNSDSSNWWAPNAKAIVGMCQAAGFSRAELIVGPHPSSMLKQRIRSTIGSALGALDSRVIRYRAVVHAYK